MYNIYKEIIVSIYKSTLNRGKSKLDKKGKSQKTAKNIDK